MSRDEFSVLASSSSPVVVTEPDLIKQVLNNKNGEFRKRDPTFYMKKLLGGGSVARKGEKWFKLRKISTHAFHAGCLKVVHLYIFTSIENSSMYIIAKILHDRKESHKEVRLGKFILPANTEIVVPIGAVHHSPGIWGEDASHFNPERIADGVAKATTWLHFLQLEGGLGIVWGQTSQLLKQRLRSQ